MLKFPIYPKLHFSNLQEVFYPYPREIFEKFDIFEIFLLDGGAFFFAMEHLAGALGKDFLQKMQEGLFFAPWMENDSIFFHRAALMQPPKKEQHCWINRLYFLLPLAHHSFRYQDVEKENLWWDYFQKWSNFFFQEQRLLIKEKIKKGVKTFLKKVIPVCLIQKMRRKIKLKRSADWLVWTDMQLTWRFLVLVHSLFLLGGKGGEPGVRSHEP